MFRVFLPIALIVFGCQQANGQMSPADCTERLEIAKKFIADGGFSNNACPAGTKGESSGGIEGTAQLLCYDAKANTKDSTFLKFAFFEGVGTEDGLPIMALDDYHFGKPGDYLRVEFLLDQNKLISVDRCNLNRTRLNPHEVPLFGYLSGELIDAGIQFTGGVAGPPHPDESKQMMDTFFHFSTIEGKFFFEQIVPENHKSELKKLHPEYHYLTLLSKDTKANAIGFTYAVTVRDTTRETKNVRNLVYLYFALTPHSKLLPIDQISQPIEDVTFWAPSYTGKYYWEKEGELGIPQLCEQFSTSHCRVLAPRDQDPSYPFLFFRLKNLKSIHSSYRVYYFSREFTKFRLIQEFSLKENTVYGPLPVLGDMCKESFKKVNLSIFKDENRECPAPYFTQLNAEGMGGPRLECYQDGELSKLQRVYELDESLFSDVSEQLKSFQDYEWGDDFIIASQLYENQNREMRVACSRLSSNQLASEPPIVFDLQMTQVYQQSFTTWGQYYPPYREHISKEGQTYFRKIIDPDIEDALKGMGKFGEHDYIVVSPKNDSLQLLSHIKHKNFQEIQLTTLYLYDFEKKQITLIDEIKNDSTSLWQPYAMEWYYEGGETNSSEQPQYPYVIYRSQTKWRVYAPLKTKLTGWKLL